MRAALLVRVSGGKQDYDRQVFELTDMANQAGDEIVAIFAEKETSYDFERPELLRMEGMAKAKGFDRLYLHDPDRFARELVDQLVYLAEIEKYVEVVFKSMANVKTPEGEMFLQMRGVIAEFEKKKTRQRAASGRDAKVRKGKFPTGNAHYGYRVVEVGVRDVEPGKADVVKRMFREIADEGKSTSALVNGLNADGIPSPKGGLWTRATVHKMLTNPAYMGQATVFRYTTVRTRKERKMIVKKVQRPEADWRRLALPAIVSERTFRLAAEQLARNNEIQGGRPPSIDYAYLLRGAVRCGCCGARMGTETRRDIGHTPKPTYRCMARGNDSRPKSERGCTLRRRAEPIDQTVFDQVVGLLRDPDAIDELVEKYREGAGASDVEIRSEIEATKREIANVKKQRQRLLDTYAKSDSMTKEDLDEVMKGYTEQTRTLQARIARAEQALEAQEAGEAAYRDLTKVCERLASEDRTSQREAVRRLVQQVTVGRDGGITIQGRITEVLKIMGERGRGKLSTPSHQSGQYPPVEFNLQVQAVR